MFLFTMFTLIHVRSRVHVRMFYVILSSLLSNTRWELRRKAKGERRHRQKHSKGRENHKNRKNTSHTLTLTHTHTPTTPNTTTNKRTTTRNKNVRLSWIWVLDRELLCELYHLSWDMRTLVERWSEPYPSFESIITISHHLPVFVAAFVAPFIRVMYCNS